MLPSATYHQKTNDLLSLGGSSTFPLKDVNLPLSEWNSMLHGLLV